MERERGRCKVEEISGLRERREVRERERCTCVRKARG